MLSPSLDIRSVTLDDFCSKRYCWSHAVADAPDEPAPGANPTPRGRVAQAAADGRDTPPRIGVDPARDSGDDGTLSVARAGDPIVSRRGHIAPRRSCRDDDRRGDRCPLSQGPGRRVRGGAARVPGPTPAP